MNSGGWVCKEKVVEEVVGGGGCEVSGAEEPREVEVV